MPVLKDSHGKQKQGTGRLLYIAHDHKKFISAVVLGHHGVKPEKVFVWYYPKLGESKGLREFTCWWCLFQFMGRRLLKAVKYL